MDEVIQLNSGATLTALPAAGLRRTARRDVGPWNLAETLCSGWALGVCKLIIGVVSAYDIYLTILYANCLPMMEMNPIGRWLMDLDAHTEIDMSQTASFIAAKFMGNFATLIVLDVLFRWRRRIASAVGCSVATAQVALLIYLVCADGRMTPAI